MPVPRHEPSVQHCDGSGAGRPLGEREVDRGRGPQVEGNRDGGRGGKRQYCNEGRYHRHAGAARGTGCALARMMLGCRMMLVGLHARSGMAVMCLFTARGIVAGRRCMVVIVLCRSRERRTGGHRCGSEALKRQRQQRHPEDQDFQEGFHAAILAQPKTVRRRQGGWAGGHLVSLRTVLCGHPFLHVLDCAPCILSFAS